MKTRHIAALAASGLAMAAFSPAAAQAATANGTTHMVAGRNFAHSPNIAASVRDAFQKNVVHGAKSASVNGLSASVSATETGAETFEFDTTASDSASTITGYTIDFGDGSAKQSNTNGSFTYKYAWAGTYTATVTVTDAADTTQSSTVTVTTGGSDYTPYGPTRILDTRNGTGAAKAAVGANGVVALKVAGAGIAGDTIPAGVTAVAMNVTVTNSTRAGYITAYPDQTEAPDSSNINYGPGQTIPDLVVVPVGADGVVDLQNNSSGTTQLIADVVGYYTETKASQYTAIAPYRLVDTRKGTGTNGVVKQIPGNGSITVQVEGANGGTIPAAGVTAISANITVTNAKSNGFITAYPDGELLPNASNVNYAKGQTVPNMAVVPVGSDGKIVIHNTSSGSTDVVVDVSGYDQDADVVGTDDSYLPLPAMRVLDTRDDGGFPSDAYGPVFGFPDNVGATSAVLTATVTDSQTNGYVTLYPFNTGSTNEIPNASNVNYGHGQTVANLAFASFGTTAYPDVDGDPDYWIGGANFSNGSTQLILDLEGLYFNN